MFNQRQYPPPVLISTEFRETWKSKGPLEKAWLFVGGLTTVIGLSSLTDDLIAWGDFVQRLIISYKTFIYPLWDFFFFWLSVDIPEWIKDYLTIGVILTSSLYRGLSSFRTHVEDGEIFDEALIKKMKRRRIFSTVKIVLMNVTLWPIQIVRWYIAYRAMKNFAPYAPGAKHLLVFFHLIAQWIGAILILFIVFLILSYAFA